MNKVVLIGRLARDPEMRTSGNGTAVTRFTVAVSRPYNPNANGQAATDFIGCVAFRRQAETIAKYCTKGSQVAVDGRIQTGSYDGADGQRHYTTDVVADNVTFLGSRGTGDSTYEQSNNYSNQSYSAPSYSQTQPGPSFSEPNPVETTDISEDPFKDFGDEIALSDDDLPF